MFLGFLASLTVTNYSLLMLVYMSIHIACKFSHFVYIPNLSSSAGFSSPSRMSIASPLNYQSCSHSSSKRLMFVFTVVVTCSEQRFPSCFYPRVWSIYSSTFWFFSTIRAISKEWLYLDSTRIIANVTSHGNDETAKRLSSLFLCKMFRILDKYAMYCFIHGFEKAVRNLTVLPLFYAIPSPFPCFFLNPLTISYSLVIVYRQNTTSRWNWYESISTSI
jgi:hypothetical protein